MQSIPFYKYQGAGNDFIMIDQRHHTFLTVEDQKMVAQLCDRRFGIGADGLILLESHPQYDFQMVYFNADGREGSLCGNGGRCAVAFAYRLGAIEQETTFLAVDGVHRAKINLAGNWVELEMMDVATIEQADSHFVLDTGSPHFVTFVEELDDIDVVENGRAIRYNHRFRQEGINVNFAEINPKGGFEIATYERGVEDETLACGTGVTAAALAFHLKYPNQSRQAIARKGGVPVQAKGGELMVRFEQKGTLFTNIWLCGPAENVFDGTIPNIEKS